MFMLTLTRTDSDKCEFIGQENWPYFYFTSKFYVYTIFTIFLLQILNDKLLWVVSYYWWGQKNNFSSRFKLEPINQLVNINIYTKRCMRSYHVALCISTFSFSFSPLIFLLMISLSHKCRKLKDLVLLPFPTSWSLPLLISLI